MSNPTRNPNNVGGPLDAFGLTSRQVDTYREDVRLAMRRAELHVVQAPAAGLPRRRRAFIGVACPCESGARFEKCHGRVEAVA